MPGVLDGRKGRLELGVFWYIARPALLSLAGRGQSGHWSLFVRALQLSQIACDAALILVTPAKPLNFFIHEGRP
jgi:hypothetical protein